MFKNRTTGELLVLMVAGTVCGYVILTGTVVVALAIFRPEVEVGDAARNIVDIINTMIGLLAGFLAGRTDSTVMRRERQEEAPKEPPS